MGFINRYLYKGTYALAIFLAIDQYFFAKETSHMWVYNGNFDGILINEISYYVFLPLSLLFVIFFTSSLVKIFKQEDFKAIPWFVIWFLVSILIFFGIDNYI